MLHILVSAVHATVCVFGADPQLVLLHLFLWGLTGVGLTQTPWLDLLSISLECDCIAWQAEHLHTLCHAIPKRTVRQGGV